MAYKYSRPEKIEEPDWSIVIKNVEVLMNTLENENYLEDDYIHYIFEAAVMAIYGKDVWKYINERL